MKSKPPTDAECIKASVSTGKSIQCFIHPQFHRTAKPEDLEKITRRTARAMKKCKREIIRDLQTGEAMNRERMRDLERMNARLEQEIVRLQRDNALLARELSNHRLSLPPLASISFASSLPSPSPTSSSEAIAMSRTGSNSSAEESSTASSSARFSRPSSQRDFLTQTVEEAGSGLEMVSDYSEESPLFAHQNSMLFAQPHFEYESMNNSRYGLEDSLLTASLNVDVPMPIMRPNLPFGSEIQSSKFVCDEEDDLCAWTA
jgi:hypothetical protein